MTGGYRGTTDAGDVPAPERPALDLAAIRARAEAATPGPWEWLWFKAQGVEWRPTGYGDDPPPAGLWREGGRILGEDEYTIYQAPLQPFTDADADFIRGARTDIPALLDRVAELEAASDLADRVAELEALTATCLCGTTPLTYEGPEPDCPVHGAVRAFNEASSHINAAGALHQPKVAPWDELVCSTCLVYGRFAPQPKWAAPVAWPCPTAVALGIEGGGTDGT